MSLRIRLKEYVLIIVGQACCLFVGLLLQHHQTAATIKKSWKDDSWQRLETWARHVVESTEGASSANLERTRSVLGGPIAVALVDDRWRVTWQVDPDGADAIKPDEAIEWENHASPDRPVEGCAVKWGTFADRVGVAYALPEGGYLVCHQAAQVSIAFGKAIGQLWLVDGITFLWIIALSATMLYLQVGRHHDKLDEVQSELDARVLQRSQALIRTRDAVIFAMSRLADYRDHETGNHLERISAYSTVLATELARHPKFADRLTPSFIRLIGVSSVLHDIGKIGIEDSILHKPGPLSLEQRDRMKQHALLADECLREIQQRMGHSSLLDMGRLIAVAHHERWDGAGYPYGISGEQIPLEARIVAVADVYDALATRRVYKEAIPHDACVDLIRQEAGHHFDPDIVEVWLRIERKFLAIGRRYADREIENGQQEDAALETELTAGGESRPWNDLVRPPAELATTIPTVSS